MLETARWDIVHEIWKHSKGTYFSIARIDRLRNDKFTEVLEANRPTGDQYYGQDLYFSACGFNTAQRVNASWMPSSVLFADLDPVDPFTLDLAPSVAWETSPGNWQAVWYLDRFVTNYVQWANLNKRMTYHTGADTGGWTGSKLLRVPGTANFKRAGQGSIPLGQVVIEKSGAKYNHGTLDKLLPPISVEIEAKEEAQACPVPPSLYSSGRTMNACWPTITLRGRHMLTQEVNDRSLHIVRTVNELVKGGLDKELVFFIVWGRPWNKWRTDRNDPERLWEEIQRVEC